MSRYPEGLDDRADPAAGGDGIGPEVGPAEAVDSADTADPTGPERARRLFRYLGGDEWTEYRSIMGVFADTFFAEFTPDDVIARLKQIDPSSASSFHVHSFDVDSLDVVVPDRLESLRRWGNLTVSTSVGNPSSLDDYYRRRNRYLITREGQEVHDLVEGVLNRVDEVSDVQSGRLRDIHEALVVVAQHLRTGLDHLGPEDLGDAVRAVFDPHESFTTEITQFFASLNQWQSRYDLDSEDLQFFAEILVGYVSEQLAEIERVARPISRALDEIEPSLEELVEHLHTGLAARVDAAGLGDQIAVRRTPGSQRVDWEHLATWFQAPPGGRSRLDDLTGEALSAVRTLTANLTRLSGVGIGSASRRADFIRLAGYLAAAPSVDEAHRLAAAAFGLGQARHLGVVSDDADDPVPTTTPWFAAPQASVPVAIRQRGDATMRGRVSPIRDRSKEKELLRRRRERIVATEERTAIELLEASHANGSVDGAHLSDAAFVRLRDLVGRSSHRAGAAQIIRRTSDAGLVCEVRRRPGVDTTISCPEGRLRLIDLDVRISSVEVNDAATVNPRNADDLGGRTEQSTAGAAT